MDVANRYLNGETVPETIAEKNTVIDLDNLADADQITRAVSEEDWYWVE